jgi:uncharacterized protein YndB with AHSA1/START domain
MKWITIVVLIIGAITVLGAVAALVGSRMPQSHRASGERRLTASPERLWRTLIDVEAFPSWRGDVKRVQRLPDHDGKTAWVEDGGSGKITFVFDRLDAPHLIVSRIADPKLPFGGTWTFEISPMSDGCRLRITEDGQIYNPLFRFIARFIFGYDRTIDTYLSALETKFGRESRNANR